MGEMLSLGLRVKMCPDRSALITGFGTAGELIVEPFRLSGRRLSLADRSRGPTDTGMLSAGRDWRVRMGKPSGSGLVLTTIAVRLGLSLLLIWRSDA